MDRFEDHGFTVWPQAWAFLSRWDGWFFPGEKNRWWTQLDASLAAQVLSQAVIGGIEQALNARVLPVGHTNDRYMVLLADTGHLYTEVPDYNLITPAPDYFLAGLQRG